jgi:hypothetical protein
MSEKINDADVREGAQHLEHVNSKVDIEDGAVTGDAAGPTSSSRRDDVHERGQGRYGAIEGTSDPRRALYSTLSDNQLRLMELGVSYQAFAHVSGDVTSSITPY